ncbi:PiggyBac transposable element-derived protein [Sergentomyia squamirostris]
MLREVDKIGEEEKEVTLLLHQMKKTKDDTKKSKIKSKIFQLIGSNNDSLGDNCGQEDNEGLNSVASDEEAVGEIEFDFDSASEEDSEEESEEEWKGWDDETKSKSKRSSRSCNRVLLERNESSCSRPTRVLFGKDGIDWNQNPPPPDRIRMHIGRKINKISPPGPSKFLESKNNLLAIFKTILTPTMAKIIVSETNRKATEEYNELNIASPTKQPRQFDPLTEDDFYAYVGLLIANGLNNANFLPLSELWKTSCSPIFRGAMSKKRFASITTFLRFDNKHTRAERQKTDKAAAIRHIWNLLNENLQNAYVPHDVVTIDEQLYPYRGRTNFTQYIPSKPAKYGIKFFWVCDAETYYPLQGILYTGKEGNNKTTNVGEKVVTTLTQKYSGTGLTVVADNFFSSLSIAKTLMYDHNLAYVGTVRINKRFIPPEMKTIKGRTINSTVFGFHEQDYKCGVDVMDQMVTRHSVKRKTNRWPLALFHNIIDVTALATYKIYCGLNPKTKMLRRKILDDLSLALVNRHLQERSKNPMVTAKPHIKRALLDLLSEPSSKEKMECFAGPENIMTDLEQASVGAFRKFYPGVTQSGCFFHFCQALYAKIKVNSVLLKKYKSYLDFVML